MTKSREVLTLKCRECYRIFKCLEKTKICVHCLARKMHVYDDFDYDQMVHDLLSQYRMDAEFRIKCRTCHKQGKTTKRGIFNYGFKCEKCSEDEWHRQMFLPTIKEKIESGKKLTLKEAIAITKFKRKEIIEGLGKKHTDTKTSSTGVAFS